MDIEKDISTDRITKVRSWATLEPGDIVQVREADTRLTFEGKVAVVRDDGTYDVTFDDDSTERAISETRIRKVRSHRFSADKAWQDLADVLGVGMKLLYKQRHHQQERSAAAERKGQAAAAPAAAAAAVAAAVLDKESEARQTPSRLILAVADEMRLQNEWIAMQGGQNCALSHDPAVAAAASPELDTPRRAMFAFEDSESEQGDDEEEDSRDEQLEGQLRREWIATQHRSTAGPTEDDILFGGFEEDGPATDLELALEEHALQQELANLRVQHAELEVNNNMALAVHGGASEAWGNEATATAGLGRRGEEQPWFQQWIYSLFNTPVVLVVVVGLLVVLVVFA